MYWLLNYSSDESIIDYFKNSNQGNYCCIQSYSFKYPSDFSLFDKVTTVPVGHVGFVNKLRKIGWENAWLGENEFRYYNIYRHFWKDMFNQEFNLLYPLEVGRSLFENSKQGRLFIRSDSGDKLVAGNLYDFNSWLEAREWYGVKDRDLLIVAKEKDCGSEYRLWFGPDGKAITGSQYMENGEFLSSPYIPKNVTVLAERAVEESNYKPFPFFVLDVSENDGEFKIMEANPFNCSGFYSSDMEKIVQAVEGYFYNNDSRGFCYRREHGY